MSDVTISSTQSYDLAHTLASGTNIDFIGVGGTLTIEPAAVTSHGIGGNINGFAPGDHLTIDNLGQILLNIDPLDSLYAPLLLGSSLTIGTNGAVTSSSPLYPDYASAVAPIATAVERDIFGPGSLSAAITLSVVAGKLLTENLIVTASGEINACFAAGTHIQTAAGGQARVEALTVGDELALHGGGSAPIIWIGKRTVAVESHPRPAAIRPVLIARHALAEGLPRRDLAVSPDHALFLDGHLIPAKALLNGATVRQLPVREITYYHIELAEHAVLLAEGVPAESYLDTGNRQAFETGGVVELQPDFAPGFAQALREEKSCAPLVEHGPAVEAVRTRILARAGIVTTADAALDIRRENGAAVIASRAAVPGEISPDPRDRRRLGVKIASLKIGGRAVALDHPLLTEGWHAAEADGRWTDGRAVIPAGLLDGAAAVEVELAATLMYPLPAARPAARAQG
jgi:hypothetical protein